MSSHSATPFATTGHGDVAITDRFGNVVATTRCAATNHLDADFIVTACNAHDAMFALLKEMSDAVTGDDAFDDPEEACVRWCETANQIVSVLAKVKP